MTQAAPTVPAAEIPRAASRAWIGLVALAAVFAISRTYAGVRHDARLYFGDALARLHPQGVGRDPIFLHDGQFGFSLYSSVVSRLIAAIGVADASLVIVIASLGLWFAVMFALTRRLFADRPAEQMWLARVLVAVAPAYYGASRIFSYAEPFATPRILAEAVVLGGLAAALGGRRFLALACFGVAALFHPIMALGGLAVFYLMLCLGDWRWLWAVVPGAAAVLAAAAMGLPLVDRLIEVMDPQWRMIVEARSPHVFPSLWKLEAWGRLAVQAATLTAAAAAVRGPARNLLLATLIAGVCGVLFALVFGDGASLVLVLQAQTWRTLWLVAVLAAAGLAVCIFEAPRRGIGGLIALGLLLFAWLEIDSGWIPLVFAGLATATLIARRWIPEDLPPGLRRALLAAGAVIGVAWLAGQAIALASPLMNTPGPAPVWAMIWFSGTPGALIAAVAALFALRPDLRPPAAAIGALALALAAILLWDRRLPYDRFVEEGPAQDLRRMLATRPGEVLWLSDNLEPWFVLGRASWVSRTQGAGVVFSRPLALQMRARAYRLRMGGFAGDDWRTLFVYIPRPLPAKDKVDAFCAAADAPAWVVSPYRPGGTAPQVLGATLWTAPAPLVKPSGTRQSRGWSITRAYAIVPCRRGVTAGRG